MTANDFVLYREVPEKDLFYDMLWLMEHYNDEYYNEMDLQGLMYECANRLVELSARCGFSGNLWHDFIAYILANHENAFSKACEVSEAPMGTIRRMALHDFEKFMELMKFDLGCFDKAFDTDIFAMITNYEEFEDSKVYNHRIRDRIEELAKHLAECKQAEEFFEAVTSFYKDFGVGMFGLHKAFHLVNQENEPTRIAPITCTEHTNLSDLIGYEIQKKKLTDNTDAFVEGRPANNVLLFGDAGTGKSSCVKAILNQYYDRGLRVIEVYKHQFKDLTNVLAQIKNRKYKFIIFMDDLSFEEFEIEYKYLKAVIEGGLERKPDNVLIYATSNRRHLIKESFNDKAKLSDEIHINDTLQEKLSLVARFGVTIYFGRPDKKQFQTIVKGLAEQYHIDMPEEELLLEANKWELSHGGLSGRTARQFMMYLSGKATE